jgi:hypothetical protein
MDRLRGLSRGGRLLLALAVGGALFGIATAVQADIPDGGVIHGCYQKNVGGLRVIDTSIGQACRGSENSVDWNQTGPAGARGATGPPGVSDAATGVGGLRVPTCEDTTVISQTITIAAPSRIFVIATGLFDNNGTQSGTGGVAFAVLLDSSNTVVALTPGFDVRVPGNGSGATEPFVTQGVLGQPAGTTVTVQPGTYQLDLRFGALGQCPSGTELVAVDDAALTYMTLGS